MARAAPQTIDKLNLAEDAGFWRAALSFLPTGPWNGVGAVDAVASVDAPRHERTGCPS